MPFATLAPDESDLLAIGADHPLVYVLVFRLAVPGPLEPRQRYLPAPVIVANA
jgi:hypothetical protein